MIGAIVGDVVGSRFEWHNCKSKKFKLFTKECRATDDSVMTLAVANAFLKTKDDYSALKERVIESMQKEGKLYPDAGYGHKFREWLKEDNPSPYGSFGNGAAMRISAPGYVGKTLEEVEYLSRVVTEVSHNHIDSLDAAKVVSGCIFLIRNGKSKDEVLSYVHSMYPLDFTLDEIREKYRFTSSCKKSVPVALEAFFEGKDFEDVIRCAISVGGDSDTIAAIAGSIAEPYYGVPKEIREKTLEYLDERQKKILFLFEEKYNA